MAISRRQFVLGLSTVSIASPFLIASASSDKKTVRKTIKPYNDVFQHGVASGDPLSNGVILWTRITNAGSAVVNVHWQVAEDANFIRIVAQGETLTDASRDYTVKVDPRGLSPDTQYYYRFMALQAMSPIGQTRTLPVGDVSHLRFAVASCSNYAEGYFNVYKLISRRTDLNAVIHLGDYIYETNMGTHGSGPLPGREPLPNREIVSLTDYRQRHAQYKTDPDLQSAHQKHPFIMIWDDHEIANDAWHGGAGDHNPELGEGDWQQRKKAAIQAYFEWTPIRETNETNYGQIYRSFSFGNLLDLVMLDTRLIGRDALAENEDVFDSSRSLLGESQEAWLFDKLKYSKQMNKRWRFIGQQVMFGQLTPMGQTINFDQWDGYPQSRARLLENLQSNDINNTVFLTGDIHSSWANEICQDPYDLGTYDSATGKGSVAVEFVTPPISSMGVENSLQAVILEQLIYASNPHTKYAELSKRGYLSLYVNEDKVRADWYYADTVTELSDKEYIGKSLQTLNNSHRITEA